MEGWRIRDEREAFVYYLQPDLYFRKSQVSGQNKSRLSTSNLFPNPIELISGMNTYCLTLLSGCKYLLSFEIATELFTHNLKLFNLVKVLSWHITVRFQSSILVQDLRFLVM